MIPVILTNPEPARRLCCGEVFILKCYLSMQIFTVFRHALVRPVYLIVFLLLAVLLAAPEDTAVKSLSYRSQKVTRHQKAAVTANLAVYLADGNVKIEYLAPEKRTLLLSGSTVYIYGEQKAGAVTYNWTELPAGGRAMLQPAIFAAADFLQSINGAAFTRQNTGRKSGAGILWTAIPQEQKNISKIEYVYDAEKGLVYSYKLLSKEGAVISEVQFLDYRIYNDKYYFPSVIHTVIHSTEGIIEETEQFSRIRADGAIDKGVFRF